MTSMPLKNETGPVQVLRNKNLATRFQILVEIAAKQPFVQQKDIARRIGVTSQAVSNYVAALERDGWVATDGRSRHRVTKEGVNWLLKALRELQQYCSNVERTLVNINTWAAIAGANLSRGESVGLEMRDGLIYAIPFSGGGARGVTTSAARKGGDIGVAEIDGIVRLEVGQATVVEVPEIQSGGSSAADLNTVRRCAQQAGFVAASGIEAIVSLRRSGHKTAYVYGVTQGAIEAARSGLSVAIVCTSSEAPQLLQRLTEEGIPYRLVSAHLPDRNPETGQGENDNS